MCSIRFGAYPNHMPIQIIVKNNLLKKERKKRKGKTEKKNTTAQSRD
jgi:hypothetical protein